MRETPAAGRENAHTGEVRSESDRPMSQMERLSGTATRVGWVTGAGLQVPPLRTDASLSVQHPGERGDVRGIVVDVR